MTEPETPDDQQPVPRRPDYEDFRDENGVIDWRAFRAAVAAYDPDADKGPSPVEW